MKRTTKQGPNKGGCICCTDKNTFPASCSLNHIPVCYVCSAECFNLGSCGVGRYVYMCSRPPATDSEGQCKTFYSVDVYRSLERSTTVGFSLTAVADTHT